MNLGDVPGWIALIISVASAVLSWRSLRWERLSAEAAGRSAQEAERANRLAERALDLRAVSASRTGAPEPEPFQEPARGSGVSLSIEHPQGDRYVLRNNGTEVADHVYVDESQLPPIVRNIPQDAVIRPGEGHDMLIKGVFGHPMPNQLYVQWQGSDGYRAIPLTGAS